MTGSADAMIRRIHETKAVSIWNHATGPVFWYAANVPGPFYVNTELVIGPELAARLLEGITAIVANSEDSIMRVVKLNELILNAWRSDAAYQSVITALAEKATATFSDGSYDVISGGERRDWLFSIPLAETLRKRHVFLFKNKNFYCSTPLHPHTKTLHVSDLINNAASYFDAWFPILDKAMLPCIGTLCVNTRGSKGLQRLTDADCRVAALNAVDLKFFEQSRDAGLVTQATVDEIALYFSSEKEWAARYLLGRPELFDAGRIDAKSFGRLRFFIEQDPWQMRDTHPQFFAAMEQAIRRRNAA